MRIAAFKLANTAVKASKGGNYLNMTANAGKNIDKGIKKTYIDISYSSDTKYNDIKSQQHLNGFNYPTIIKL